MRSLHLLPLKASKPGSDTRDMHLQYAGYKKPRKRQKRGREGHIPAAGLLAGMEGFAEFVQQEQELLIKEAEAIDGSGLSFVVDRWDRDKTNANKGFGVTAVLEGGALLEKAAVNVSIISGVLTAERAKSMSSRGRNVDPEGGQQYSAAALSLVFHPQHPFVPTLRADVRSFKVGEDCWYGGGCDLTPAYFFESDTRDFHHYWNSLCERHRRGSYEEYKKWCDDYFYLPARKEHRGIGGIFFDDVSEDDNSAAVQNFVRDVAKGILPSWGGIAETRRQMPFGQKERDWQLIRRGRYLEFNLLYDRGVRFGLGGRIESVMVSAPPLIAWKYNVQPEADSAEQLLVDVLRRPRSWL